MNQDVYKQSVELHKKLGGKLEVKSKVSVASKEDLSLAYTPGVAEVCREIHKDISQVYELTLKKNTVAVITDGSAVLGLGNIGPEAALPVMEGKCVLFKEFANIDAFPICLDTQDTEEIIRTIKLIAPVFGGINLEDIAAPRCFEIERRLKAELSIPVMHDDQHGTAAVVLAALINSLKLKGLAKESASIVINGAGAAGTAIAELLYGYGIVNIVVCDSKGVISSSRLDLNDEKKQLLAYTNTKHIIGSLEDALQGADVFVGVSVAGALSADMVKKMNERPIIFGLANPVPEIMPEDAKAAGAYIVATGRSDFANQINNVLAFPGIFRGALDNRVKDITNAMLVKAAEALAGATTNISVDKILPNPLDKEIAQVVAASIRQ